jgi:hypothetical protein
MSDGRDSRRPQERDFNIDQWEKFPFRRKEDPFENRSDERKENDQQSQYSYEGWEHNAFPNTDVSEQPAEPSQPDAPKPNANRKPKDRQSKD